MLATSVDRVILTISDVERSRVFYNDVLEFETNNIEDEHPESGFYFGAGGVDFYLGLARTPIANDRFSEERIGLDHVSFKAVDRAARDKLAEKLKAIGSDSKGVEIFSNGDPYVAFRDPDNIQLEFWLHQS